MAGRIGTQRMLGGKDTFNPSCAASLPLSPLHVSPHPAAHLPPAHGCPSSLMSSQKMFGLKRAVRLVLPLDSKVFALGALGALPGSTLLIHRLPRCLDISIPAGTATCCYKHKMSFGKEKHLLGHLSKCLVASAASGFQQRLQPHRGKPGCPVTAEHWGWVRRLSRAGTEMLATGFCPLGHSPPCPQGAVGPSGCSGTWDGSPVEEGAFIHGQPIPRAHSWDGRDPG